MMRIDLHMHTKSTKGESKTREIGPEDLVINLIDKDISIASITNHNLFDLVEYNEVTRLSQGDVTMFPGVELDVIGVNKERAHVIIVCNPINKQQFSEYFGASSIPSPSTYSILIEDLVEKFKKMDCILLAHYQKEPELDKESFEYLHSVIESHRIFYEPTNFRGLSINSNKGYRCLFGSDITDWSKYLDSATQVPELKLPIKTFNDLVLLSKKDSHLIETLLNRVTSKDLEIELKLPNNSKLRNESLTLYDDLNVIFGGKGSGKSKYLEFIKEALAKEGISSSFYSSDNATDDIKADLQVDDQEFHVYANAAENDATFDNIKSWEKPSTTSIKHYYEAVETNLSKRNRKYLGIIELVDFNEPDIKILELDKERYDELLAFKHRFESKVFTTDFKLDVTKQTTFLSLLDEIIAVAKDSYLVSWTDSIVAKLTNFSISSIKQLTDLKSNGRSIPGNVGFENFFKKYSRVHFDLIAYDKFRMKSYDIIDTEYGNLDESRLIYLRVHPTSFKEGILAKDYKFKKHRSISSIKKIDKAIINAKDSVFTNEYFANITKCKELLVEENIMSIADFTCISKRFFDGRTDFYEPSSGEAKLLAFQRAIKTDSDYYLFDEPEKSLGNFYTTQVILPELMKLVKLGKCIVCTTHSANIAVLGIPINTILKEYDDRNYTTYSGNMLSDRLLDLCDNSKSLSWQEKSLKLLEGGEDAFYERGYSYGINTKSNHR